LKTGKVQLLKNLRRDILRGHPWVYRKAFEPQADYSESLLVKVLDQKGKFLAWGMYHPEGPLGLRVLSLESKPPTENFFENQIQRAFERRTFIDRRLTNAFRGINGEGDGLPGLVCDLYDKTAVIQFDGSGPEEFWRNYPVVDWVKSTTQAEVVVSKTRGEFIEEAGHYNPGPNRILENGLQFLVDIEKGQKTGFFFDQRDNRDHIRSFSKGLRVMNLFSYTGGFSVYAGAGGASEVLSVDLSAPALELAEQSWDSHSFKGTHQTSAVDIFDMLASDKTTWDMVIVDPPSMAHSEKQKPGAIAKYIEVFSAAAKRVRPGGHLVLSSCSSHISFEDFEGIASESLSKASLRGIVRRFSGQGADHPYAHACPEMRYLKFIHLELTT